MGGARPVQVVLGTIKNQVVQALKSKPVVSTTSRPLHQLLSLVFALTTLDDELQSIN